MNIDIRDRKGVKTSASQQDQQYLAIFNLTSDAIFIFDYHGHIMEVNPSACAMHGYSHEEFIGMHGTQFIHPDDHPKFADFIRRVKAGEQCHGESTHRCKDGRSISVKVSGSSFMFAGQPAFLAVARDVTEEKRVVDALREREERFRATFNQTAIGMAQTDLNGRHLLVNDRYCQITGYSREELLKLTFLDITHPDDVELNRKKFHELFVKDEAPSYEIEKRYIRKDGKAVWVHVTASFVRDAQGNRQYLIGAVQDISGRKRKEQALRFLVDLNSAIQALDELGEIMAVTARMLGEHLGVDRCAYAEVNPDEEYYTVIGQYSRDGSGMVGQFSIHAFGVEALRLMYANISFISNDVEADTRVEAKDLAVFRQKNIRSAICVPLHKAGRLVAGVAVHQKTPRSWLPEEIELVELVAGRCWESIARARAIRVLRESEQRLMVEVGAMIRLHELVARLVGCRDLSEALEEVLDAVIALMNADMGNIQLLNPQRDTLEIAVHRGFKQDFLDHFGRVSIHDESACGRAMRNKERTIIEDVQVDASFEPSRHIAASAGFRSVLSIPLLSRKGELLGMLSTHYRDPHRFEGHNLRILDLYARQAADFIERMRAEEALRDNERRQRFIMDSMPQKIFTAKPNGDVEYFNPQWMKFCGLSFEQIRDWGWTQFVHPDDIEENVRLWRHSVATGELFQAEHRFRRADGEYRWHMSRAVPMHDAEGRIIMWIGSNTDIHDVKEAQKRAVKYSEQMRRLADVATRINTAHDVASVMRIVTEEARNLVGSHQSVTSFTTGEHWEQAINVVSLSDKYGSWRNYDTKPDGSGIYSLACRMNEPMRMTQAELESHPAWKGFGAEAGKHPPMRGWLAAPLVGRDGRNIGLIQLSDKYEGEFTQDDEAILVQMAQMVSVAVENARLVEDLQDASRRKDEFLATLAHELRNPLAPLRNMLEVMKRTDGNREPVQQAHDMMDRQLVHMVRLIDDLLDVSRVSRVSRGKLELRRERIELAPVVNQAVESCRGLIGCAGHEVSIALPTEPVYLYADPVRLTQIFDNLINNACKYTEPGGRIRLTAECRDGEVAVKIKDTGIGIPPDKLGGIFEMFAQVDHSLERLQGGLGIGLTLVKQLVEMHDGRVTAHSDGPGRGSEFVVCLPMLNEKPRPGEQPLPGDKKLQTQSRRILVVDDNRDSAESLAMLLEMSGSETQVAYDGLQAVEVAERFRPDLVLLDIGLPKLNGYEVCQHIRREPWGKDMMIVAISGWGQEQDRLRAQDAGFDRHIVKPVDLEMLNELLT